MSTWLTVKSLLDGNDTGQLPLSREHQYSRGDRVGGLIQYPTPPGSSPGDLRPVTQPSQLHRVVVRINMGRGTDVRSQVEIFLNIYNLSNNICSKILKS